MERDSEVDPVIDMTAPGSDTDLADGSASQLPYSDLLEPHLTADVLDEGYSPPDYPPAVQVPTVAEELRGESLDRRLAEEEPDVTSDPDDDADDGTADGAEDDVAGRAGAIPTSSTSGVRGRGTAGRANTGGDGPSGRTRSGRLVGVDEGDRHDDMIGDDAGIAGGAASAEEAAVHLVDGEPADG